MEQIVEYQSIKTLGDISKTFASIPMTVEVVEGAPKMTIANFEGFKVLISNLVKEYENEDDIIITDNNVSVYEKEAAQIKKLADQVNKDAKAFVDEFALGLLGRTTGKNKVDGQVQIIKNILMSAYDKIRSKTTHYRDLKKAEEERENQLVGEVVNETTPTQAKMFLFSAMMSEEKVEDFKNYCSKNHIEIKEIK